MTEEQKGTPTDASVARPHRDVAAAAFVKTPSLVRPCSGVVDIDPRRAPHFANRPVRLFQGEPVAAKIAAVILAGYPERLRQLAGTVGQLARAGRFRAAASLHHQLQSTNRLERPDQNP